MCQLISESCCCLIKYTIYYLLKGTVSRDFLLLVFFMNQFPPSPRVLHLDRIEFFSKIRGDIRESRCTTGINDTGGKFATGVVNDTGGKLPPVSTTPVANLPPVSATPVANFSTIFASVVDTGGNLPPVSTTPVANIHRYQRRRRQICHRCR
jgi:hypothetical protein